MRLDTSKIISKETREKLDAVLQPIHLSDEKLEGIRNAFGEQMRLANSADENVRKTSSHMMLNSFIRELFDGTEQGDYLGLDLGGTSFRVVLVSFKDGQAETVTSTYHLPDALLAGAVVHVFDFIAESIKDFVEKNKLTEREKKIPLGFTFSFPIKQTDLKKSVLLLWNKTFRCTDGPGQDPVVLLEEALERKAKGMPIEIVAIINDTVGTCIAGNYLDKKCRIGLIVGTGSNAAFVENIVNIEKWTGDHKDPKHVIVNIEQGATGDNGCLDFARCEYERDLDAHSHHPGSYTFEKSFSGMYLGELVRLVLVKLVKDGMLFGGNAPKLVESRMEFTTAYVTAIESDDGESTTKTREVLEKFGIANPSDEDIAIVREVNAAMSKRGAFMLGAAVSKLVTHINLPEVTIGVDGSLYENHPTWHDNMMEVLVKFCPNTKVTMIRVKDGSGQGAAFAAVCAQRQTEKGLRCT